jgi:hypothetical protein
MDQELSYKMELLSGFIDHFLPLTPAEEKVFEAELAKLPPEIYERIMEIITSWMRKGIRHGKRELIVAQLRKRFGSLDGEFVGRIDDLLAEELQELGEALLDFTAQSDLESWLDARAGGSC